MGGGSSKGYSGPSREEQAAQRSQAALLNQQAQYGQQLGQMAYNPLVQQLAGQGLTQAEQAQLETIGIGREQAMQGIQQNVREQASSRGLFSSAGAIGQEAANLAQIPLYEAEQRAGILSGAQNRMFQGLGLQQSYLSGAAGIAGSGASGYGNMATTAYSQRQYQNQLAQQQQAQQNRMLMSGVGLGLAPFTGGASLMLGGLG